MENRRLKPYYPVFGLLSIIVLIVILKCLSGCDLINGINREGNSPKATPNEKAQ